MQSRSDEKQHDRTDAVRILAFLRCEIDQSATLLGDLAARLSSALGLLTGDGPERRHATPLSDATVVLQEEDRIQQRLRDLSAVIAVLEQALARDPPTLGAGLDQAVIESLRLEETRRAFLNDAEAADCGRRPSSRLETLPSEDIDLF